MPVIDLPKPYLPTRPLTPEPERERRAESQSHGFDRRFFRRIYRILRYLFTTRIPLWDHQGRLFYLYFFLLIASVGMEFAVYYAGNVPSQIIKPLIDRDEDGFRTKALISLAVVLSAGIANTLVEWVSGILEVATRRSLTRWLHRVYLRPGTLYALSMTPELDYPDQRIAQDVERWAFSIRTILQKLALSPVLIGYYTYECWNLAGPAGPGIIYGFFVVSAIISKFVMSPVVRAIYSRERQEGAFRYQHTRVLTNAEAIAFHRGETRERRVLDRALEYLLTLQRRIVHREVLVNLVSQSVNYFGSILSYLIVALPIFTGKYDDLGPGDLASMVSKNSFVTMYLIFRFTTITDQATLFSDLAGYTARISQLLEEASRTQKKGGPASGEDTWENHEGGGDPERTVTLDYGEEGSGDGGMGAQDSSAPVQPSRHHSSRAPGRSPLAGVVTSVTQADGTLRAPGPVPAITLLSRESGGFDTEASLEEGRLVRTPPSPPSPSSPLASSPFAPLLSLEHIYLDSPAHVPLINDLTVSLAYGEDLYIEGPNGVGKSSLLRAISGIWPFTAGKLTTSGLSGLGPEGSVHFLPQTPYLPLGSLWDLIHYPNALDVSGEEVRRVLLIVGLSSLEVDVGGLHVVHSREWDWLLTPGQRQRLAFARMLLHKPKLVLMDEATSAMDPTGKDMVDRELLDRGISAIRIGHGDVGPRGGKRLWLHGHGEWMLEDVEETGWEEDDDEHGRHKDTDEDGTGDDVIEEVERETESRNSGQSRRKRAEVTEDEEEEGHKSRPAQGEEVTVLATGKMV
ncbi:ABC transporter transmembrane region 2-domain-containing protein [Piptocephalis cylindrospora]|uniref:ABC transporter transmembrane region 2-domain-containing protein n=1 Tax=Piptocephalis cylindrospora TaxID=1907219 RepID=A0A4P9Y4Y6_9FUNG|nr:ABC transporter transmembrane region 2-domain-containing protein [Piptocephalis cylindrospora]|eukprot:RKP13864.1 ABC transporter transmembrane region 2-domain-containing protein [Piptocephalis cylindrospora]